MADRVGRWWAYFGSGAAMALVAIFMAIAPRTPRMRFEDEVVRKRALLPRSYRLAQEGRRVASARDRSPSPEGGDSESSTVGSDA